MTENRMIPAFSETLAAEVQAKIDAKTKPPGSLGRIEALALQLALCQGRAEVNAHTALLICAADHGLVAEGVSAWPSEVTAEMVKNFLAGGAAANVFARAAGAEVKVLDCGVAAPVDDHPELIRAGLRKGSRNALHEDALTADEVSALLAFGAGEAEKAVAAGAGVIAPGEMGIGNTSSAALIVHAITGVSLEALNGPGAGLDQPGLARKLDVMTRAAARRPGPLSPEEALAAFGGMEIAAMAGAMIAAGSSRAAVLVDGYISTAAAIAAVAMRPEIRPYLIFAHKGAEPGHRLMLAHLEAEPLLELGLRLGEGSGALLAAPLLSAAAAMLKEMATFESAGVSGKS